MDKILSELTIEIIQKCANTCLFCSSLSGPFAKDIIAFEDVINVGKQARELGLKAISISGGEPLLHPDFNRIIVGLTSLGLHVSIYTTGIYLDPFGQSQAFKKWDSLNRDVVRLIFGVQSSTASVHDQITCNQGSFVLTKAAMVSAIKSGFAVEVHVVPNKINLSTLKNTVTDFISLGVEKISFLRLVAQGFGRKNKSKIVLSDLELRYLKNIFNDISKKWSEDNKVRLGIPFSGIVDSPKKCNAGESKLIIRYDGKVLPCEAFKDEEFDDFILGDIRIDCLATFLKQSAVNTKLMDLKNMTTLGETCPAQILYS